MRTVQWNGGTEMRCTVNKCGETARGRGLCNKHYLRAVRNGLSTGPNRTERALQFVDKCVVSETDECLVPLFQPRSAYPSFVLNGVYWKLGWLVLTKTGRLRTDPTHVMRHVVCRNTRCCNPRHLEWGTEKQNAEDRIRHGMEPDRRCDLNPRAQLTNNQVRQILSRYRPYVNCRRPSNAGQLAKEFGVSKNVILLIGKGETWRELRANRD